MARRQQDIPWGLWLGCLAAALLAHAAVLVPGGHVLARSLEKRFEPRASDRAALELELIEPEDEREALQFVALDQPNGERPSAAARIAEHDSDVEQESQAPPVRAAASGARSGSAMRASESTEPKPETPTPDAEPVELVDSEDGRLSGETPKPPAITVDPVDPTEQLRLLAGSPSVLADNFAAPRPTSSIAKLEPRDTTALDSRAHLYAGFYARMHERILEHYDCDAAIVRHDPKRLQLGDQQRTTVLRVVLDRSGAIETLSFVQESEVEYLDAEAVRTIRAAGPYPNPPNDIFDEHGTLVIRVAFKVNPDGSAKVDRPSR